MLKSPQMNMLSICQPFSEAFVAMETFDTQDGSAASSMKLEYEIKYRFFAFRSAGYR